MYHTFVPSLNDPVFPPSPCFDSVLYNQSEQQYQLVPILEEFLSTLPPPPSEMQSHYLSACNHLMASRYLWCQDSWSLTLLSSCFVHFPLHSQSSKVIHLLYKAQESAQGMQSDSSTKYLALSQ